MNDFNAAQLVINLVAVLLVLTPLLMFAYLAGRRSGLAGRVDELTRLRPEIRLDGTTWQAAFDGDDASSPPQTFVVRWRQSGSRMTAETVFADGTRLILEGVLHHRQLCCVAFDRSHRDEGLGAVLFELRAGDCEMVGFRARWSPKTQTLLLRKATLRKLDGTVSESGQNVQR